MAVIIFLTEAIRGGGPRGNLEGWWGEASVAPRRGAVTSVQRAGSKRQRWEADSEEFSLRMALMVLSRLPIQSCWLRGRMWRVRSLPSSTTTGDM